VKSQGESLQTGRKPFPGEITLSTTQLYGEQTKIWCGAIKLIATSFSTKRKNAVFCDISLKEA